MELCSCGHDEICYSTQYSRACPLCEANDKLEEAMDKIIDLETENMELKFKLEGLNDK